MNSSQLLVTTLELTPGLSFDNRDVNTDLTWKTSNKSVV